MTKVLYNCCFGGFSLSPEAYELYCTKTGAEPKESDVYWKSWRAYGIPRHDPTLVSVVEELGLKESSGEHAEVGISTGTGQYRIDEYDGNETVV